MVQGWVGCPELDIDLEEAARTWLGAILVLWVVELYVYSMDFLWLVADCMRDGGVLALVGCRSMFNRW